MSTLAEIRDAIEYDLKDTANALWSADELDEHIRRALRLINRIAPRRLSTTLPSVAAQYEYDLSSIAGLLAVVDVWYPYDAGDPQYPPTRPRWTLIAEDLLLLWDCDPSGDSADAIRIFYTVEHTIAGLDADAVSALGPGARQRLPLRHRRVSPASGPATTQHGADRGHGVRKRGQVSGVRGQGARPLIPAP